MIRSPRVIFVLLWSIGFFSSHAAFADTPPNILFLLSDDQSYPYLSCYGDNNVDTPNIDRLAHDGMKFHRFFTSAPQCVLSRASFMTGKTPLVAQMIRFSSPLPRDQATIPEVLRAQANYYTGVCGRSYHLDGSTKLSTAVKQVYGEHDMKTFDDRVDYLRTGSDAKAVEQTIEFLDSVPSGRPFFLWTNFSDPHHPWNAPAEFRPDPASLQIPRHLPDLPGVRNQLADHCAEINRVDHNIGKILAALEDRSRMDDTIIVFAGDNGQALPHGKGSLYDPGCNVPFVVRWPGVVQPGRESSALLSGDDLAPTLLKAVGCNPPKTMTGHSFVALLKNDRYQPRDFVYTYRGPHGTAPVRVDAPSAPYDMARAVRNDRYKLIYNCTPWPVYSPVDSRGGAAWKQMESAYQDKSLDEKYVKAYFANPRPVYEFYDLNEDPAELNNLSGDTSYRDAEIELRTALARHMIVEFDHLPLPDTLER